MAPPSVDVIVIARPGSRKESIEAGEEEKSLVIHVTEQPEKGKANKAILRLLAKKLGLSTSQVTLLQGATSTTKRIRVEGIDDGQFKERLQKMHS
nr:DUF167 domain-containing protein [Candidatus Sigynarchaeota archaeon]